MLCLYRPIGLLMGGVMHLLFAECIAKALPEYQAGTVQTVSPSLYRSPTQYGRMICITTSSCAYLLQDSPIRICVACWSFIRSNIDVSGWISSFLKTSFCLGQHRLVTVVVMSKDLKGKRASLWHAYTALQEQGKDKEKGNAVAKGQLKVCNIRLI